MYRGDSAIPENRHADNGIELISEIKLKHDRGENIMPNNLVGKTIAILATDGFEQSELIKPKQALEEAGASTQVVSPTANKIKGWDHKDWGEEVSVDVPLKSADPSHYDALLLPGGVMNPDQLRMNPDAVKFVKSFIDQGKPVAAICHGPWMLVEAGAVRGRTVTSWPSLKTDIQNAGGTWVDEEVVESNGVITSRKPDDIPAFNREMIARFSKGGAKASAGSESSERKIA
jgi:protease I